MRENREGAETTEVSGYRLQLTLVDLIDLALQIQHVRWNLFGEPALRTRLDDFDGLVRAGADTVAGGLRELGVPPMAESVRPIMICCSSRFPAVPSTPRWETAGTTDHDRPCLLYT